MDTAEPPAATRTVPPELTVIVPCYNERPNVAPMVARLDAALAGVAWEVLFVDDNSPDGTAATVRALAARDGRVRCIRRIGRRGLASAVIEGALASSAPYLAVIDGDLQHDETCLPAMLALLRADACDLVVGSRHVAGGGDEGLVGRWRHRLSEAGIRLAQHLLPAPLADPMSGYFMVRRPLFEQAAPRLTATGFKILVDLLLSAPAAPRVIEVPYHFHARTAGESKLDVLVLLQFAALLLDKVLHGVLPLRFVSFAAVGGVGIVVNLAVLNLARAAGLDFGSAVVVATLGAMGANFVLNNSITYRDQRLRGPRLWRGLAMFMLVCGIGNVANVGVARMLYFGHAGWTPAAALGAAIGVVWNFAVSNTLVWRR
jgi:dolichol-phosphate mannosyltransferase